MATPILTAVGLGGIGLLGFSRIHRWMFLSAALALLGLSFYLNVIKQPTRLNLVVFSVSSTFVVGSAVITFSG